MLGWTAIDLMALNKRHSVAELQNDAYSKGANMKGSVYDCTPHEKPLKRIDIHNVSPFPVSIRSSTLFFYMGVKLL